MFPFKILLIGSGQLGSRHLQGLANCDLPLDITIIEPNDANLRLAVQRYKEVRHLPGHQIIRTNSSFDEIMVQLFDLVIIATNSDIRAQITSALVNRFPVKYIVFEKVVFQNELQFDEIINMLQKKGIKSWVNCARRYFPFYRSLREELRGSHPIKIEVTGVEWGLACNAVHHIDLLSYLAGEESFQAGESQLEDGIYESKRKGFKEFYGRIGGISKSGNQFSLICNRAKTQDEKPWLKTRIDFEENQILIDELAGKAEFFTKGESIPYKSEEFNIIYQSSLTNLQAHDILKNGTSLLPSIEESYESHKVLFEILRNHICKITGNTPDIIPIT